VCVAGQAPPVGTSRYHLPERWLWLSAVSPRRDEDQMPPVLLCVRQHALLDTHAGQCII
jgi:hypothetical protein